MLFVKRILGFLFWLIWMAVFNAITFSAAAIVLVMSLFLTEKHASFLRKLVMIWSRVGFILAFSPVEVRGLKYLVREPAVIVSNHQSTLDILILAGYLPVDFLFFSKKEIFFIPLVGQLMRKMGYVSVDRKNPKRAANSIRQAVTKIKANNRVLIFPEGTRSEDPQNLLPFKPGSLMIARQAQVPILPLVIYGTNKILPINKKFFMLPHRAVISVLEPIRPENPLHPSQAKSVADEDHLLENLRDKMNRNFQALANEMAR